MKLLSSIPSFVKNKFLLTGVAFAVWMVFFDRNDMLTQRERRSELSEMQKSKEYYIDEIAKERKAAEELKSNPITIEKYAREKYGMKRDNEDVFIIQAPENKD